MLTIKKQKYKTNGVNVDNNSINDSNNTQIESESESEIEIERERENKLLNYTTLDLLFNYLRYKEEKFDGLTEEDREIIIFKLKNLDLYVEEINYIPPEKLFEIKIQYWVIMEIYISPYKVYFNKLKRNDFFFKFLKTKQYIDYSSGTEEDLRHFVSYFIKSLRDILENKEVKNE